MCVFLLLILIKNDIIYKHCNLQTSEKAVWIYRYIKGILVLDAGSSSYAYLYMIAQSKLYFMAFGKSAHSLFSNKKCVMLRRRMKKKTQQKYWKRQSVFRLDLHHVGVMGNDDSQKSQ